MTTITLTTQRAQAMQAECAEYNAANGTSLTLDDFVQLLTDARADGAVRKYGSIPVFQFVQRIPTAKYQAVKDLAAAGDAVAAGLLDKLQYNDDRTPRTVVELFSTSVAQGLAYLVGKGVFTQADADAIGAITFGA